MDWVLKRPWKVAFWHQKPFGTVWMSVIWGLKNIVDQKLREYDREVLLKSGTEDKEREATIQSQLT